MGRPSSSSGGRYNPARYRRRPSAGVPVVQVDRYAAPLIFELAVTRFMAGGRRAESEILSHRTVTTDTMVYVARANAHGNRTVSRGALSFHRISCCGDRIYSLIGALRRTTDGDQSISHIPDDNGWQCTYKDLPTVRGAGGAHRQRRRAGRQFPFVIWPGEHRRYTSTIAFFLRRSVDPVACCGFYRIAHRRGIAYRMFFWQQTYYMLLSIGGTSWCSSTSAPFQQIYLPGDFPACHRNRKSSWLVAGCRRNDNGDVDIIFLTGSISAVDADMSAFSTIPDPATGLPAIVGGVLFLLVGLPCCW